MVCSNYTEDCAAEAILDTSGRGLSQNDAAPCGVLRQESLGHASSHSQLRACIEAILQQQGDNKPLGKHWTTRFAKRHPKLSTKLEKGQKAARLDGFTQKAVNWYFDIRETEYGWIKLENTINVDEGGIMAGFGKPEQPRDRELSR
ncbi:Uncharacterized protein HZ326_25397 [Fusarium oxysporum f. sp. albedinis]|nr:Uncharacterized protein HZ326_25397 [Fusarium oxysporum f. sp. albedinis]